MDNILQLNTIQEIKDKGIRLYSHNRDDYCWQLLYPNSSSYHTYKELNSDKSNNDHGYDVSYSLNDEVWKNWLYDVYKQEENYAAVSAIIKERLDGKQQVGIRVDYNILTSSITTSAIIFNTRDEAAKAIQRWFDTYIFDCEEDDGSSQDNDLLDKIYDILK